MPRLQHPLPENPFPDWDSSDPVKSLDQLYKWAVRNAEGQIDWYVRKKRPKRIWSLSIRAMAIILAGLGALCPLLDATGLFQDKYAIALGEWGYVLLAIAAGVVGFDRYFGFSTGWMRYIVTQEALEKALKEFRFDWVVITGGQLTGSTSTAPTLNVPICIQKAKDFTAQVESLVRQETDAWVQEFQANITQLEKILKMESETRKPGSIKVIVSNARDFDQVSIRLNDVEISRPLSGDTERILPAIPPGRYEVTAVGSKKGAADKKDTKVVEVQPNTMASIEINVP